MVPSNRIHVEDVETCLICGQKGEPLYREMRDRLFSAPGVWSHLRCPQDGHVWLSPRPVIEDIAKVYATYYTHELAVRVRQPFLASLKRKVEYSVLNDAFGYKNIPSGQSSCLMGGLWRLVPMAKEIAGSSVMWLNAQPDGKLLDVGCGNGTFLALMQGLGWDVAGVEPDQKSAMIASRRLGSASVFVGTIEAANFSDDSFDAVTAHHVIEHMYAPIGFLREAWRILKPGGRLVVTTPNIDSLGHRVFHRSWRDLDPPRHLHLFSPRTLGVCLEKRGFWLEMLRTTARSAWEIWYSSRLIQKTGNAADRLPSSLKKTLQAESLAFQLFEHMLQLLKGNLGEGIVLIARKNR